MYSFVKPLLFRFDPEEIHEVIMKGLAWSAARPGALRLASVACELRDPRLKVDCFGLSFPNPIGLAAGFDKNARAVHTWAALGFGAVEIGSVTALAQPGNPRPRLFRLPEDGAIINRMGFNNEGAEAVAARLARLEGLEVPLGVNLGKSKVTPLEEAPGDYRRSMELLWPYADYFVINVSSPNTPGLRELQDKDKLTELLAAVKDYADERGKAEAPRRPVLLKIAPDLTPGQLDSILELTLAHNVAGLIATNTTISREGLQTPVDETGGLSGKPLAGRSLEVLRYLRAGLGEQLPLVSVGGIFTADDVYERLRAGASLVQIYTGFVYEGPRLVRRLNRGLLARLEREGIPNVAALVGSEG